MAIINVNGISGINSITAQSGSLNFYTAAGNTLSIGASVSGNITGNVTGNLTGDINAGVVTASSSIVVGNSFIRNNAVGLGQTTTTGRNAGVGTATGTLIYNATSDSIQVYSPFGWADVVSLFSATGGTESTSSRAGYKVHTFTSTQPLVVSIGTKTAEYLIVAGGGGGGSGIAPSAGHGGGGGGGVLNGTLTLNPGTYTITVGAT